MKHHFSPNLRSYLRIKNRKIRRNHKTTMNVFTRNKRKRLEEDFEMERLTVGKKRKISINRSSLQDSVIVINDTIDENVNITPNKRRSRSKIKKTPSKQRNSDICIIENSPERDNVQPVNEETSIIEEIVTIPHTDEDDRQNLANNRKNYFNSNESVIIIDEDTETAPANLDNTVDDVAVIWTSTGSQIDKPDYTKNEVPRVRRRTPFHNQIELLKYFEDRRPNLNYLPRSMRHLCNFREAHKFNRRKEIRDYSDYSPSDVKSVVPPPIPTNVKKGDLREIIVDGCNVARAYTNSNKFSETGIKLVVEYFQDRGHVVKVFLPQHKRSQQRKLLEKYHKEGIVFFTASRKAGDKFISSYDDRYILKYANMRGGIVISLDQFRDLYKENPEWRYTIENRILQPTFVGDIVMFPDDPLGKGGPNLNDFLRH